MAEKAHSDGYNTCPKCQELGVLVKDRRDFQSNFLGAEYRCINTECPDNGKTYFRRGLSFLFYREPEDAYCCGVDHNEVHSDSDDNLNEETGRGAPDREQMENWPEYSETHKHGLDNLMRNFNAVSINNNQAPLHSGSEFDQDEHAEMEIKTVNQLSLLAPLLTGSQGCSYENTPELAANVGGGTNERSCTLNSGDNVVPQAVNVATSSAEGASYSQLPDVVSSTEHFASDLPQDLLAMHALDKPNLNEISSGCRASSGPETDHNVNMPNGDYPNGALSADLSHDSDMYNNDCNISCTKSYKRRFVDDGPRTTNKIPRYDPVEPSQGQLPAYIPNMPDNEKEISPACGVSSEGKDKVGGSYVPLGGKRRSNDDNDGEPNVPSKILRCEPVEASGASSMSKDTASVAFCSVVAQYQSSNDNSGLLLGTGGLGFPTSAYQHSGHVPGTSSSDSAISNYNSSGTSVAAPDQSSNEAIRTGTPHTDPEVHLTESVRDLPARGASFKG